MRMQRTSASVMEFVPELGSRWQLASGPGMGVRLARRRRSGASSRGGRIAASLGALAAMLAAIALEAEPAAAGVHRTNLWPGGILPFEFDRTTIPVGSMQEMVALDAMQVWEDAANVTFRPVQTGDIAWIHFRDSSGDLLPANYVGLIGLDGLGWDLGQRRVNITDWNLRTATHELGHILGMPHEQNRWDRDSFVQIETANAIGDLFNFNFLIDPSAETYGPYDFGSIMHYWACAFSLWNPCSPTDPSCRTITVLPPNDATWQTMIGTLPDPSAVDRLTLSFLYPESDWRFVDDDDGTLAPGGTFLDPWVTVSDGAALTPTNGTLWIQPGSYDETVTFDRELTVRAPLGDVAIGR